MRADTTPVTRPVLAEPRGDDPGDPTGSPGTAALRTFPGRPRTGTPAARADQAVDRPVESAVPPRPEGRRAPGAETRAATLALHPPADRDPRKRPARTSPGRRPAGRPPGAQDDEDGPLLSLPASGRRIVQCLAVLGEEVPLQRLRSLTRRDEDPVGAVEAAVAAELLSWDPGEGRVEAAEATRESVIAAMSASETRAAHRWAARWTGGVTSLLHRAAAATGFDEDLARRLESEARRLGFLGRSQQAAELLRRAAAVSADAELAAHREAASVEFALRAHDLAPARRAAPAMRQDGAPAAHRAMAGRLAVLEGRIGEGARLLGEACRELRLAGGGARDELGAAALWSAKAQWLAGSPATEIRQQLAELDPPGSRDPYWAGERRRLDAVLTSSVHGPARGLGELAARPGAGFLTPADVRGRAAVTEAWLHLEAGDPDRCETAVRAALAAAAPVEDDHIATAAQTVRGHALWLNGSWTLAEATARGVAASSAPLWRSRARALLSLVAAARGERVPEAAADDEDPGPCVFGAGERLFTALVAAEAAGRPDVPALLTAPEHRPGLEFLSGPLLPWRKVEVARAAVEAGHTALATALIASLRADATGLPSWVGACALWLEARASARGGSRDVTARLYAGADEAADGFEATAPWYYARYQADHAEFLAAVGDRRAAVDRFRAAWAVALRIGAQPLRKRCATGLRALRLPQPAGAFGLTARETEVARLVSTGLTNREAAARLFVTPASVAFHLGNIYGKLGVRTRYELRRWWAEQQTG
ncbi:helix-turn-helix domain-containing protein [Streptomyces cadmiisoli]|uniref:HTH luxR-type domain-containing protein n=1 Tax=Streptomyces cadmiisoli TaxID=2184053 RepID=A0A2Z4JDG0_9ACTN|nr:helix-turn-helix transcriptional regulator [Streptomyces cadmiisoli]AWW43159.1 hypothetical protein DN051_41855 [Streptomyces cadmiisoli]